MTSIILLQAKILLITVVCLHLNIKHNNKNIYSHERVHNIKNVKQSSKNYIYPKYMYAGNNIHSKELDQLYLTLHRFNLDDLIDRSNSVNYLGFSKL